MLQLTAQKDTRNLAQLVASMKPEDFQVLAVTVLGLGPVDPATNAAAAPIGRSQLAWVHALVNEVMGELHQHINPRMAVQISFIDIMLEQPDAQHIHGHSELFKNARVREVDIEMPNHEDAQHPDHVATVEKDIRIPDHGLRMFIDLKFGYQGRLAVLSHLYKHHQSPAMGTVLFVSPFEGMLPSHRLPGGGQHAPESRNTLGQLRTICYHGWTPSHSEVVKG